MTPLFIDIETVRDDKMPAELWSYLSDKASSKVKADGRIKDPDKIEADISNKRMEAINDLMQKMSLDPLMNKIICITICIGPGQIYKTFTTEDQDEKGMLTQFCDYLWDHTTSADFPLRVVTFNGYAFDLRILRAKFAQHEIRKPPFDLMPNKYDTEVNFDIRQILNNFDDKASGTLGAWMMRFRIPFDQHHQGTEIQDLYDDGNWNELMLKCKKDVEALTKLYYRLNAII